VNAPIKAVANKGEQFRAIEEEEDWYKIELSNGDFGYVANWIIEKVETTISENVLSKKGDLKDKVIVIDPGHGGKDSGTIGFIGTLEKDLTINTANLLAKKLKAAGSKVIFTRKNDFFVSLQNRVSISNFYHADAFISIHYDSIKDSSITGMTSYYYTSSQKELATELHASIIEATNMKDRGVRRNDYFVLRENNQPATLLELGYLSNSTEEQLVLTPKYQETITTAIYKGLKNYFN
jgi:N-acetylmuramoyl-L-alanine amidase